MSEPFHLILDQNIPRGVATWLRSSKPDWIVIHTSEVGLSGAPDEQIFAWAQQRRAAILTIDEGSCGSSAAASPTASGP